MELDRLFSVPTLSADVEDSGHCHTHLGCAAELLATAELLERGHKVAIPVVDDDGVDLVVDYRVRVQVKSGGRTKALDATGKYATFSVRGQSRTSSKSRYSNVDVWMFFDRNDRTFYVVPASSMPALGASASFVVSPKYAVWREAWHVFSDLAAVA